MGGPRDGLEEKPDGSSQETVADEAIQDIVQVRPGGWPAATTGLMLLIGRRFQPLMFVGLLAYIVTTVVSGRRATLIVAKVTPVIQTIGRSAHKLGTNYDESTRGWASKRRGGWGSFEWAQDDLTGICGITLAECPWEHRD